MDIIFARYPYPREDMVEHLCRNARALNLPYRKRVKTFNSRRAQELGLWAQDQGRGDHYHDAAFKAYFVDGENLTSRDVLLKITEQAGLDPHEAQTVLASGSYTSAVHQDWQRAELLGIDAVPTLVIGEDKLVGAQEYRSMAKFVSMHGIRKAEKSAPPPTQQ